MATHRITVVAILVAALPGCAGGPSRSERTVFSNPYVAPVVDRTGIGPQCEQASGSDATCLGVPVTRRGRGSTIGVPASPSLTRNQRRILRERAALLRQSRDGPPIPPTPPRPDAPPIAVEAEGAEAP